MSLIEFFFITGDVDERNGISVKNEKNSTTEECNSACCTRCRSDICGVNPLNCLKPENAVALQKCVKGCGNGALSYQANAFVTTALLFMFYLIN